jgi:hypothetical protein
METAKDGRLAAGWQTPKQGFGSAARHVSGAMSESLTLGRRPIHQRLSCFPQPLTPRPLRRCVLLNPVTGEEIKADE